MEIFVADSCGFCFGVKRAVDLANNAAELEGETKTLGPTIHK